MAKREQYPMPDLSGGACASPDGEVSHVFTDDYPPLEQARYICRRCPLEVAAACLDWALHHEADGVWAGTTPEERNRERRRRGITLLTPLVPDHAVRRQVS